MPGLCFMHSFRNPKWLFLTNTAPVLVFLLLGYGEFAVVHTLLPAASVAIWQLYGAVLAALAVGAAGYAATQLARQRPLGAWFSAAMLLAYSLWLCLLTTQWNQLVPAGTVPRWMLPTEPTLMAWTFLMPTLAYAMLVLVARFTPDDRPQNAGPNILLAVGTPVVWWLVSTVLSAISDFARGSSDSYTHGVWDDVATTIMVVTLVLSTLSFFFFLTRALFIITQRRAGFWADTSPVWKVIITIVLPLLGLAVNNGVFFGNGFRTGDTGIFGNFTSPWFYVLAVLNGALLCLPDSPRPGLRLVQLLGRSALFGYTFYFFLVFLPFLPLAVPAIILIGTGFLLLAPLLLFVVHVRQLSADVAALQAVYARAAVRAVLVGGLAVLPLFITGSFWHRRQVLHEALAYVYTPNFSRTERLDPAALTATLAVIRQNKDRNMDFLFGSQQPYLSTYFNWLVLDNLMLSEHKLDELERVFAGPRPDLRLVPASWDTGRASAVPTAPQLHNATASSTYDARQQAWVSWVNLEIVNPYSGTQNGEYSTTIALPTGCWVGDYYLTIGNRQERGILAEKKAADWVYAQIVSENRSRDPGLLTYQRANELALRVYPVSGAEVRRTRIQLLHKEPCTVNIDGRTLALGDSTAVPPVAAPVAVPGSGVAYVSGLAKQGLPLVQRRPYYHFLVDASAGQAVPMAGYRERITRQLAQPLPNGAPARFSLVNMATTTLPADTDWAAQLDQAPLVGGYYLTGAIQRALFEAQQHPAPIYPVLVAVTDNLADAVLDADFEAFSSAYPETDVFYVLGADGQLVPHSLRRNSRESIGSGLAPGSAAAVRAWPNAAHPAAYLPNDATPGIVLAAERPAVPALADMPTSRWLTGLLLSGYTQWQTFHPEATDRERVPFIQASFQAGILTPFTSFLALENEAQKAALRRKQAETMAANASLDAMEQDQPQNQPTQTPLDGGAAALLVAGVLLGGWYLRRPAALANG